MGQRTLAGLPSTGNNHGGHHPEPLIEAGFYKSGKCVYCHAVNDNHSWCELQSQFSPRCCTSLVGKDFTLTPTLSLRERELCKALFSRGSRLGCYLVLHHRAAVHVDGLAVYPGCGLCAQVGDEVAQLFVGAVASYRD